MGSGRIEMSGQRFGRLLVVQYDSTSSDGKAMWLCICDCGEECVVSGKNMRMWLTKSCGCLHKESTRAINLSHEMCGTPTYMSWASMLSRCYNKKQESYLKYGALGVTVCDRWRDSFENFLADMGIRPEGMTLDRKNPFGNYESGNCKWSNNKEQAENKRGRMAIEMLQGMGIDLSKIIIN